MDWWSNMFLLSLPVAEKILRPILVYLFLVIGLRVAGKRELAQLNPFDLVVLLTISNTVQNAIIGNDNSVTGGVIGATTLLIINAIVVRVMHRNPRINALFEGKTDFLIEDGEINQMSLRREVITRGELQAAARKAGYQSLDDITEATIDANGAISFIPKQSVVADAHQQELIERLDLLTREMGTLRSEIARIKHSPVE